MIPKISIIIPFKNMNNYVKKCISKCLSLNYKNYDIILLPDRALSKVLLKDFKNKSVRIRCIPTGKVHPSIKRNKGIINSDSDFIASIDSDAYPNKNWLNNAMAFFKDTKVSAVGGPNLATDNASIKEKAAIDVNDAKIVEGIAYFIKNYSFKEKQVKGVYEAREQPSSNLILRKSTLQQVKGYSDELVAVEDSILCNALRAKGYLVLYAKNVIVHHRRRPLFRPHLSRLFTLATNKAVILKNNLSFHNLIFFVPSLFVLFILLGIIFSFFHFLFLIGYLLVVVLYLLIVVLMSIRKSFYHSALVFSGIILTHFVYGLGVIIGLFNHKRLRNISN